MTPRMTAGAVDAARAALDAAGGGPAVAVVLAVDGPAAGRRLLLGEDGECRGTLGDADLDSAALDLARRALHTGAARAEAVDAAGARTTLFVEAYRPPEELLVVGAGHIAIPLTDLGHRLGYRVTVLDDREEFATAERFRDGVRVLRTDFTDPFREARPGPRTHVILVTRAHRFDFDCLRRLLEADPAPASIGMIGSRRRVRAAFHALLEAGIPRDRLAAVRAPLGLDIAAETPEEIAVSIAAELVLLRRAPERLAAAGLAVPAAGAGEPAGVPGGQPGGISAGAPAGNSIAAPAGDPAGAPLTDPADALSRVAPPRARRERVLERLLPEKGSADG